MRMVGLVIMEVRSYLQVSENCGWNEKEDDKSRKKKNDCCNKDAVPFISLLLTPSLFVQAQKTVAKVVASVG
jgi:hypothetical protein